MILVVLSESPGVGKTSIARLLASRMRAAYLRIDTIEAAFRGAGGGDIGALGYTVANRIGEENLRTGVDVVADCVNPVSASRDGWRRTAAVAGARITEIRVICSDEGEHRHRLESRVDDLLGRVRPTWNGVVRCQAEPRDGSPHLLVDTAVAAVAESVERCLSYVSEQTDSAR